MQAISIEPNGQAYSQHLNAKLEIYQKAMEISGFERLIIGSGSHNHRFRDDCFIPYYTNSYFEEFVSLPQHPNSFLIIEQGGAPQLFVQHHDDFWHSEPESVSAEITHVLAFNEYQNEPAISIKDRTAYIGPDTKNLPDTVVASLTVNPNSIFPYIDYHRAWKTEYEKHCLRQANKVAVSGHLVAEQRFRQSASEYEIHMSYLQALRATDADLPYDNIIALNEHAAVLHHMHLSRQRPDQPKSFLIDAGARYQGYAADISRTYAYSEADSDFSELISAVDALQRNITQHAHAGESYLALHLLAHRLIAGLLSELNIVKCSAEEALGSGVTRAFFPHGIGHLLGIQVHDKGGHMAAADGTLYSPPDEYPSLRLTRTIEENMAFTIEPGVYFIPKLLSEWRGKAILNEPLVDKLMPFGGVRIEDNIIAGKTEVENLTRNAFKTVS